MKLIIKRLVVLFLLLLVTATAAAQEGTATTILDKWIDTSTIDISVDETLIENMEQKIRDIIIESLKKYGEFSMNSAMNKISSIEKENFTLKSDIEKIKNNLENILKSISS